MNLIREAKNQIKEIVVKAYEKAAEKGTLPPGAEMTGTIEIPKDVSHGDYACGYAMASARTMRMAPRKIADALVAEMELEGTYFKEVTVAGAGFMNFRLSDKWYGAVLEAVENEGEGYGASDIGGGEKVMVEFVSANPTGPMTIGNARGGVLGDTLASILSKAEYDVYREFYVNDAGNQVDLFGKSIEARYLQLCLGEDAVEFPEDGYHGDDIKALAKIIFDAHGKEYLDVEPEERRKAFVEFALPHNIELMKKHLQRYRIKFDNWFLESSLHKSGYVAETVKLLEDNGYTYEKDGALWLRNTEL
ncbi:MAG: arginine--tRNA ligase, partial [Oscillospiraceae bacterium]|nr:arginine--tRNA ligase [Oscillospiraceae bacterium]